MVTSARGTEIRRRRGRTRSTTPGHPIGGKFVFGRGGESDRATSVREVYSMTGEPVTPAQEMVTTAMLASFLTCTAMSLVFIDYLNLTGVHPYLVFGIASFVVSGYLVPNLTAYWLGKPLHVIMDPSRYEHQPSTTEYRRSD
jgi:hypothetical protein